MDVSHDCHARTCFGHPRRSAEHIFFGHFPPKHVDGRVKPGHYIVFVVGFFFLLLLLLFPLASFAQNAPISITPPPQTETAEKPVPPPPAPVDNVSGTLCALAIAGEEKKNGIPSGLLSAVSMVESGRRDPASGQKVAWPWTIYAEGEGKVFHSKTEAMAAVVELLKRNVSLIDIGCMQVNLYHHPNAFRSLENAFSPADNVAYAAKLLKNLAKSKGSWTMGVAAYHAGENGTHGGPYLSKVLAEWRGDNQTVAAVLRESWDEQPQPLDLAYKAFDKGDMVDALKRYRDILKLEPDSRIALLGSAMAMEKLGQTEEAFTTYRRVLIADPYNRLAFDSLLERIEVAPAQEKLEKLADLHRLAPHFYEAPARIAEIYIARNGLESAANFISIAANLAPEEPRLRLNLALIEDRMGRRFQAIKAYEQFLKLYDRQVVSLTVPLESIIRRLNHLKTTPE
jgi:tetratricopeptide (TPR) repeat protein